MPSSLLPADLDADAALRIVACRDALARACETTEPWRLAAWARAAALGIGALSARRIERALRLERSARDGAPRLSTDRRVAGDAARACRAAVRALREAPADAAPRFAAWTLASLATERGEAPDVELLLLDGEAVAAPFEASLVRGAGLGDMAVALLALGAATTVRSGDGDRADPLGLARAGAALGPDAACTLLRALLADRPTGGAARSSIERRRPVHRLVGRAIEGLSDRTDARRRPIEAPATPAAPTLEALPAPRTVAHASAPAVADPPARGDAPAACDAPAVCEPHDASDPPAVHDPRVAAGPEPADEPGVADELDLADAPPLADDPLAAHRAAHRAALAIPFEVRPDAAFEAGLDDASVRRLARLGHWYERLTDGRLVPISDAQHRFVRTARGLAPPAGEHERLWAVYRAAIARLDAGGHCAAAVAPMHGGAPRVATSRPAERRAGSTGPVGADDAAAARPTASRPTDTARLPQTATAAHAAPPEPLARAGVDAAATVPRTQPVTRGSPAAPSAPAAPAAHPARSAPAVSGPPAAHPVPPARAAAASAASALPPPPPAHTSASTRMLAATTARATDEERLELTRALAGHDDSPRPLDPVALAWRIGLAGHRGLTPPRRPGGATYLEMLRDAAEVLAVDRVWWTPRDAPGGGDLAALDLAAPGGLAARDRDAASALHAWVDELETEVLKAVLGLLQPAFDDLGRSRFVRDLTLRARRHGLDLTDAFTEDGVLDAVPLGGFATYTALATALSVAATDRPALAGRTLASSLLCALLGPDGAALIDPQPGWRGLDPTARRVARLVAVVAMIRQGAATSASAARRGLRPEQTETA